MPEKSDRKPPGGGSRARRILFRLVWVLVCAALLVGGYLGFKRSQDTSSTTANATKAIAVNVAKTRTVKVSDELQFVGSLSPQRSVWVSPFVSGHVVAIKFEDGQKVEAGDLLYQLDDRQARAELASAQSKLDLDRSKLKRDTALQKRGLLPTETLELARAQVRQSENTLSIKKINLDLLTIKAPFGGILGRHKANIGQYVSPGDHLVELTDFDHFQAEFKAPERYLQDIAPNAGVTFSSTALPHQTFAGEVSFIDPSINPSTRSFAVRATISNADNLLRAGLFGQVVLKIGKPRETLMVPTTAVVYQLAGTYVFKNVKGVARQTVVETGVRRGDMVEITSGLSGGDSVVTSGQFRLRDGTPIDGSPMSSAKTSPNPTRAAKRS